MDIGTYVCVSFSLPATGRGALRAPSSLLVLEWLTLSLKWPQVPTEQGLPLGLSRFASLLLLQ